MRSSIMEWPFVGDLFSYGHHSAETVRTQCGIRRFGTLGLTSQNGGDIGFLNRQRTQRWKCLAAIPGTALRFFARLNG